MDRKSVHVRIGGRVQGVWYRGWTVDKARSRDLDGWVRNRTDGTVEAVFSGPADQVDAMIEDCRQGPPAAQVSGVAVETADTPDQGFRQLPTI
jgi:acylphosphatase